MYLHPRVDVHSETRTQYHSLRTPSRYQLTYYVLIAIFLSNGTKFKFIWYCFFESSH
ncbi:unnamed protein product [Schistosoma mattheei]|uniref:Uncharacterized protein n=1 Tax=Schistosoma mattheei TaxID=31246 RepID=A0A183PC52_9TREM|nr:unnamed protein product [Schistosoma mattheei]